MRILHLCIHLHNENIQKHYLNLSQKYVHTQHTCKCKFQNMPNEQCKSKNWGV
jgi:hypothetical protein